MATTDRFQRALEINAQEEVAHSLRSPIDSSAIGVEVRVDYNASSGALALPVHVDPNNLTLEKVGERWQDRIDFVFAQSSRYCRQILPMPRETGLPPGTLIMLVLCVLQNESLHGYAIARRIHQLSSEELAVEERSLYPALQKLLLKGWVKADWTTSDTGRNVREYRITQSGRAQLTDEMKEYRRVAQAIEPLLGSTQIHREMLAEMPGEQPPFGNTLELREDSRNAWGWS